MPTDFASGPEIEEAFDDFSIANPHFSFFIGDKFNKDLLEIIRRMIIYKREKRGTQKNFLSEFDFFPGNFIAAGERIKRIMPEIKKIRTELFGKEEPPFDYDHALEWLKKEARKKIVISLKKNQLRPGYLEKLKNKTEKIIDELNKIQRYDYHLARKAIAIPLFSKNGHQDDLITFPGTGLRRLADIIKWLSWNTNFSEFSLLMFILAGIEPLPPSYSISREVSSYGGKTTEIKIFRPLNQKEFMLLFRYVSKFEPRKKKMNTKNLRIYEFIEKRDGPPSAKKMKFWKDTWEEWNRIHPEDKYKSSNNLRLAYVGIKKRI